MAKRKSEAVRTPVKTNSSSITIKDLIAANVPVIVTDTIFENRIHRVIYLILRDYQNVFARTGIYQDVMRFAPATFLEYFESVTRIMLLSLYRTTWAELRISVGRLSAGKVTAMLHDLVLPDYVLALIYPVLQPIMLGNNVLIPGPNCQRCIPRTHRDTITIYGGKLNGYDPIAADFGAYIRAGTKFGYTRLFTGVKTHLTTIQLEEPTLTVWPVMFCKVPIPTNEQGEEITRELLPKEIYKKPLSLMSAENIGKPIVETMDFVTWNAEFEVLKKTLVPGLGSLRGATRSWYFPNCHAGRDPNSFMYHYSIVARVDISSPCCMEALERKDAKFEQSINSSIAAHANNVYCRPKFLNTYALFESLFARREHFGRVTINEAYIEESRLYDQMISEMFDFWDKEVFPTIQDSFVFEFPKPIVSKDFMSVGKFTLSAHTIATVTVKMKLPKKQSKAVNVINFHQAVEEPAEQVTPSGIG